MGWFGDYVSRLVFNDCDIIRRFRAPVCYFEQFLDVITTNAWIISIFLGNLKKFLGPAGLHPLIHRP